EIERRQQGFAFLLHGLGVLRQTRAKDVRAQARSPLRLLERREQREAQRLVAAAIERGQEPRKLQRTRASEQWRQRHQLLALERGFFENTGCRNTDGYRLCGFEAGLEQIEQI